MKKIASILTALIILFTSVSLAEDLPSLSDADLLELYRQVSEEIECRNLSAETSYSPREDQLLFPDFLSAVDAAGEYAAVGGDIDYLSVVMKKDGKFIRMITLLDDHARELYMAAMSADDAGESYEVFKEYAWSLPISYSEEITEKPKAQAELDAQAGKTAGQLIEEEGYSFYGAGGGIDLPVIVDLSYGMFSYTFEAEASFEEYLEYMERDDPESLKLKSGTLSGFSGSATDLDYLADGTLEPQVVPNITAEEALAVYSIPPIEEYTVKAWPLTDEGYSDLLANKESRYGQVYLIKGVVHEVLSRRPLTVIINTGEDGKSQPVMVEFPEQPGFSPEAGSSCRIYADVSSACYILPVLIARYSFTN